MPKFINKFAEWAVRDITKIVVGGFFTVLSSSAIFLWDKIKENTEYTCWAFIILLAIILILSCLLLFQDRKNDNIEDLKDFKSKSVDNKRYNIILIDDDNKIRTKFKKSLSSIYNICIIDKIDSELYLHGFDIIIFDVVNTVTFNDESCLDIIKILRNNKPYKYIIAISTESSKLNICKQWVNSTICKSDADFENKLKEEIENASSLLDKPDEYWKKISSNSNYFKKEKEVYYKTDYINTLKHYPHFSYEKK